jgi:uncharacterized protein (TIGR01777 family)
MTGASGFVGSAAARDLESTGAQILRLVRRAPAAGEIRWDPARGEIDAAALEGVDAVVHLAGESIAGARWTPARKASIRSSRIDGTALVARTLAALTRPPRVLVCASAAGWYGDRGDALLPEDAAAGTGFFPQVCEQWEAAAEPARARGIRVVSLRFGLVLDASGGALARMLPIFRLGLGAPLGDGKQYWSWIGLDDVVQIIRFAIGRNELEGPVNTVAPRAPTNDEFTRALCRAVGRWKLPGIPRFVLRLLFGEMADEALLASARLDPTRLRAAGYVYRDPDLDALLQRVARGSKS